MAKNYHKFQNEMTFYILRAPRDTPNDDLWIIVTYAREVNTDIKLQRYYYLHDIALE